MKELHWRHQGWHHECRVRFGNGSRAWITVRNYAGPRRSIEWSINQGAIQIEIVEGTMAEAKRAAESILRKAAQRRGWIAFSRDPTGRKRGVNTIK